MSGKGSTARPSSIPKAERDARWDQTFAAPKDSPPPPIDKPEAPQPDDSPDTFNPS